MSKSIYYPNVLEKKWREAWESQQLFQDTAKLSDNQKNADKQYILFAFAYPSGSGLHVGHVESKTALDILARFGRMNGKHVFFPVGWDAFGLPAENYAIKTGIPPATTTKEAINTFRRQIKEIGISYDWANEIATNHPEYYKWTQWLFLQFYKKGLAYQGTGMVNWCPKDQTVLANEQVVSGRCERCGTEVIQKELEQWFFKITAYQEELLTGLDGVDWPEATKEQQKHWIGKKSGIEITYPVEGTDEQVKCFTTRPDTNFGATFIVLAPEHELIKKIVAGEVAVPEENRTAVVAYVEETAKKTELDRQMEGRKKTGAFTGLYATNRLNGKRLPIWTSDFVLAGFGTGAVVGVPAHDARDFAFAQAFGLDIVRVVSVNGETGPVVTPEDVQEEEGVILNSDFLNGMEVHQATAKIMDYLEEKGWGKRVTTYKLRDWLISRQRYWGAPIPVVYDPQGKAHPVKEEHLPWMLPTDVDFKPTGESPLKSSKEFIERTEQLYGKGWRPEFDTMDTFVDSSWYYLRYADSRNQTEFADKEQLKRWLPVDLYMIGPEHIVLHLLYSRFFTKFLRDEGYLTFSEPFMKMRHQGMILGPDGKKMSKSKGNVINPDEVIAKYGADTLRMYEMFMGPIDADKPWNTNAVSGVYRFLNRVYDLVLTSQDLVAEATTQTNNSPLRQKLHQTILKVTDEIPKLKFNTAIAGLMELVNVWESEVKTLEADSSVRLSITRDEVLSFIKLLAPFAPFLAEELYQVVSEGSGVDTREISSIHLSAWPSADEKIAQPQTKIIPVQINGKVRGQIEVSTDLVGDAAHVIATAKTAEGVSPRLEGQQVVKEIYVPGKIVNLVVAG